MGRYFDTMMTYAEAQRKLFTIVEGKSQEEIEEIKREYSEVVSVINRRELSEDTFTLTEWPL